jgi:uncharacterized protein YacL (UPF0231 family)
MREDQRTDVIPQLDSIALRADKLREEIDSIINSHQLYKDESLAPASLASYQFVRALKNASDTLKRANTGQIESYVTSWHLFRVDDEQGEDVNNVPQFESISYQGSDDWVVIMTTATHGRERLVVNGDTVTWTQVYSADPY